MYSPKDKNTNKGRKIMSKDEILQLATGLYDEALLAQTYFSFIKQFHCFQASGEYNTAFKISPCFYQLSYGAWLRALVMELSKIYDSDKKYNTLKILKEQLKEINPNQDFAADNLAMFLKNDNTISFPIVSCDLCLVSNQYVGLYKIFSDEKDKPIRLRLPYTECISFFDKKWSSVSKEREKLRQHRNQVFAHNGFEAKFDFNHVNKDYPLHYADIERLIDYAIMITRFTIGMLTDISKPTKYSNCADWEATLQAAEKGRACIDEEFLKSVGQTSGI